MTFSFVWSFTAGAENGDALDDLLAKGSKGLGMIFVAGNGLGVGLGASRRNVSGLAGAMGSPTLPLGRALGRGCEKGLLDRVTGASSALVVAPYLCPAWRDDFDGTGGSNKPLGKALVTTC